MPDYKTLQVWVNKLISFCLLGFAVYSVYQACASISVFEGPKPVRVEIPSKEVRGGDSA